jgi:hypothetical protein
MKRFTVKTEGLKEAVRDVGEMGDRARDLKPPLQASVIHWQHAERRRFATNRGWKKDTEKWAKQKRRQGLDARTMRATGRLEAALTNATVGSGAIALATKNILTVGVKRGQSPIYYARPLAKKTRTNPRQSVVFDRKAKLATGETVMEYVTTGRIVT